jgi:hypothetical protein
LKVEDVRGLRNAFSAVSVVVDEATFQLTIVCRKAHVL